MMLISATFIVLQTAALFCAIVAGVFLTFSDFVMQSLASSRDTAGVTVMQQINQKVYKTVFMVLLLGMAVAAALLGGYALLVLQGAEALVVAAGAAIYLGGVIGVTSVCNVPMNNTLQSLSAATPQADSYWRNTYLRRWTLWNHVRVVAAGLSAVCFMAGAALAGHA